MKNIFPLLAAIFILTQSAAMGADSKSKIMIVPKPVSVVEKEGGFTLSPSTLILIPEEHGYSRLAAITAEYFRISPDNIRNAGETTTDGGEIVFRHDPSLADEQYRLDVSPHRIVIYGSTPAGIFYGVQSLRQLALGASVSGDNILIPAVEIKDKPHFGYRSGMLDCSRHFFPVEDVKSYIDILAAHKMNTFHWHLTDDQGWRIEILQYPELTRIGSVRDESLIGHYRDTPRRFDGTPYGGYYTQDDIREIVWYAADRYITVIPEIEMPGHAEAALASFNALGCTMDKYKVEKLYGVFDEVFCAGRESTFNFLENVLTEVMELFPSEYIHIGGDECPKTRWKACPDCQKRMADNNLANEEELQSYFMQRMEKFLNAHGRKVIGWDEILEGGISETATVMSWRGYEGGIEAAKKGNYVVMVPTSHCYLDYYQANKETEPLAIGGNLPVSKTYELDPYYGLNADERKYILGVQGNIWTEYIEDMDKVQYMILPRLAAIAETGWTYGEKDFDDFVDRMRNMRRLYDAEGYNYGKHMFNPDYKSSLSTDNQW